MFRSCKALKASAILVHILQQYIKFFVVVAGSIVLVINTACRQMAWSQL